MFIICYASGIVLQLIRISFTTLSCLETNIYLSVIYKVFYVNG